MSAQVLLRSTPSRHAARACAGLLGLLCALPAFAGAGADAPPAARRVEVVDQVLGLSLPDPYRWMEGEQNAEFKRWLQTQGEYTREHLDTLPSLRIWQQALRTASAATVVRRNQQSAGGRLFFIRQTLESSGALMVREADGSERVLLDPTVQGGADAHASITIYAPSPDGRKVAVDLDRAGNELTRLEVIDVASGKPTGDAVEPVWGEFPAYWLPDGSGFAYTQIAPPGERTNGDLLQDMRLRLHKLGGPPAQDPVLLRAGNGTGSNPSFPIKSSLFPAIDFSPASPWAIATATGARPEQRICVARREEALKADAKWRCIADFDDQVQVSAVHGDTLYLLSAHGHPNGRLLAVDLAHAEAGLKDAREIFAAQDGEILSGSATVPTVASLAAARDALYLRLTRNGSDRFVRVDYRSGDTAPVALAHTGSATLFSADPGMDGFMVTLQDWTTPPATYQYLPGQAELRDLKQAQASPADYGMIASDEVEATSADGTRVPLTILHRKDAALDGSHKAIVLAYGGYGLTIPPRFRPVVYLEWVKRGGIFAIAHVRGGGEKGDAWHRAGQGPNKPKGVADFLACVQRLNELGYARPERTALISGSMGGLMVGGAIVRYPGSFGAAIVRVGLLNPVRLLHSINGANQLAEVGDPRKLPDLAWIRAMDPYQNVRPRTAYPAVMLDVGLNDSRVSTWETGKFAARLRAASTSGKPIWIRTNAQGGHGIQTTLDAEAAEYADIFAFLDAQLATTAY